MSNAPKTKVLDIEGDSACLVRRLAPQVLSVEDGQELTDFLEAEEFVYRRTGVDDTTTGPQFPDEGFLSNVRVLRLLTSGVLNHGEWGSILRQSE